MKGKDFYKPVMSKSNDPTVAALFLFKLFESHDSVLQHSGQMYSMRITDVKYFVFFLCISLTKPNLCFPKV